MRAARAMVSMTTAATDPPPIDPSQTDLIHSNPSTRMTGRKDAGHRHVALPSQRR
jgi:hypothetical protein